MWKIEYLWYKVIKHISLYRQQYDLSSGTGFSHVTNLTASTNVEASPTNSNASNASNIFVRHRFGFIPRTNNFCNWKCKNFVSNAWFQISKHFQKFAVNKIISQKLYSKVSKALEQGKSGFPILRIYEYSETNFKHTELM